MSIAPGEGNYLALASGRWAGSGTDEREIISIFANSVEVPNTQREDECRKNRVGSVMCIARVTGLLGGQFIDMRWKTDAGNTLTLKERSLTLLKIA